MEFKHTNLPVEKLPKLVRDNIPAIILKNEGHEPQVRVAEDINEFLTFAFKKVIEEAMEIQNAQGDREELVNELADLRELTYAIMKALGISDEEIEKVRIAKQEKNGGFEKRYILEKK